MEKIYGTKKRQDCLVRTGRSKWILFYGFGKDDENSENGWEYRHTFVSIQNWRLDKILP